MNYTSNLFSISDQKKQSNYQSNPMTKTDSSSFSQMVDDKNNQKVTILDSTMVTESILEDYPMNDMTLDEYKQYIYNKINKIPVNSYKNNWEIYVSISDEAFEAMLEDPEYEQWVLSQIESSFTSPSPYGQEVLECMKFGKTKSNFRHEKVMTPTYQQKKAMRKKYQEERRERKRLLKKEQEKKWLEAKWFREEYHREYINLKYLDHKIQLEKENQAIQFSKEYKFKDNTCCIQEQARRKASRKVAAYEASFMISTPCSKVF